MVEDAVSLECPTHNYAHGHHCPVDLGTGWLTRSPSDDKPDKPALAGWRLGATLPQCAQQRQIGRAHV